MHTTQGQTRMATKKKSQRRKTPKRGYKPESPIVSLRLSEGYFADLKAEAEERGATVTDVIRRRLLGYAMLKGAAILHAPDAAFLTESERASYAAFRLELSEENEIKIKDEERGAEWQQMM